MIELRDISRLFHVGDQEVHALDHVDLEVGAGEYMSIMGPSGSGKSTLLNVIGLLDKPTSGTYLLNDRETTALDDNELAHTRGKTIGFVFQAFHLVSRMTAFENVELPMVLAGIAPSERRRRVDDIFDDLGLSDRAHHRSDQLSGGQRQRVAIARAMVMSPAVLLADEPTGNLDQASGRDVLEALEALNRRGLTLLVVTHDENIGARSNRRIRMIDGRIVEDVLDPEVAA